MKFYINITLAILLLVVNFCFITDHEKVYAANYNSHERHEHDQNLTSKNCEIAECCVRQDATEKAFYNSNDKNQLKSAKNKAKFLAIINHSDINFYYKKSYFPIRGYPDKSPGQYLVGSLIKKE